MSKKQDAEELVNLLVKSLRHKIGSIVNENEFYSNKYAKDSDVILNQAKKATLKHSWSREDKKKIKEILARKLRKELEEKTFINNKKFEVMDGEIENVLEELELD